MRLPCLSRTPRPAGRLIVRPAHSSDHDAIREVVRAAYQQYEPVTGSELFSRYIADLLDFERHSRDGRLIVAELDGSVLGSGAFYPDVSTQGVGWPRGWAGGRALAVHPAARGHGVAQALLAAAECLARHHGAPVFALHTASFMTTAVALYDRLGYRRAPEFDRDLGAFLGLEGQATFRSIAYVRDLRADRSSVTSPADTTRLATMAQA
jgi:GNAT superfamily N-acetyltransferase